MQVIVWKMDGSIRATLKRHDQETDALKRTSVLAICPLPSQAHTLAVASTDGKVAIWRIADAAMVYLLDTCHFGTMGPMATTLDNKVSDLFHTCALQISHLRAAIFTLAHCTSLEIRTHSISRKLTFT
jgi:hypothetical protein